MDPTLGFQGEWYSTGLIVTTGMLVAVVIGVASWRLIGWLRERKNKQRHKLLPRNENETFTVYTAIKRFFKKEAGDDCEDLSETCSLKRSSTLQSKASLVSNTSRNSIPPVIVQAKQSSEIHIPERRTSSFSIDSSNAGFEIEQYQNEIKNENSDNEGSIKSKSSGKKKFSSKGESSYLADPLEEDEEIDEKEGKNGEDEEDKIGNLMFTLEHDKHRDSLSIHVIKITDLVCPPPDNKSTFTMQSNVVTDPYVKIVLLPEGKQKAKTRIVRKSKNPVFEESFTFYGIKYQKLFQSVVKFTIVSHDRFSKDQVIGHVLVPITMEVIPKDRHLVTLCKTIHSSNQSTKKEGEIFLSLNFDPSNNKLTVVVLKAKNLPRMDMAGLADPYVKVYFICDGCKSDKKKTQVKRRTLNPVYNETFHFTLPSHFEQRAPDSSSTSSFNNPPTNQVLLRFMIFDYDKVAKNEAIGKVEIGPEVKNEKGLKHWRDVMDTPRKQLAVWHKIK